MTPDAKTHDEPETAEEAAIQRLLVRALERREDEGEDGVAALLAEHPEHAAPVRRRIDLLETFWLLDPPNIVVFRRSPPS